MNSYETARQLQSQIWFGEIQTNVQLLMGITHEGGNKPSWIAEVKQLLEGWSIDTNNPSNSAKIFSESSGVWYDAGTPVALIKVFDRLINTSIRVKLDFGDTGTSLSWGEMHDTTGYIRRTGGSKPCLILVHNMRSSGGGAILTANILKIQHSNSRNGGMLYSHS